MILKIIPYPSNVNFNLYGLSKLNHIYLRPNPDAKNWRNIKNYYWSIYKFFWKRIEKYFFDIIINFNKYLISFVENYIFYFPKKNSNSKFFSAKNISKKNLIYQHKILFLQVEMDFFTKFRPRPIRKTI